MSSQYISDEAHKEPVQEGNGDFTPNLVLIAEDDEPIALALSFVVEDAGFDPIIAMDGRQALELAHSQRPALIITDLMMPRMSGKQFIEALRTDATQRLPPIVVMTAGDPHFADEIGADAFLSKPFDVQSVEKLLERFLNVKAP